MSLTVCWQEYKSKPWHLNFLFCFLIVVCWSSMCWALQMQLLLEGNSLFLSGSHWCEGQCVAPESRHGQGPPSSPRESCGSVALSSLACHQSWAGWRKVSPRSSPGSWFWCCSGGIEGWKQEGWDWGGCQHKPLCHRRRLGSESCRDETRRGRGAKWICASLEEGRGWMCGGIGCESGRRSRHLSGHWWCKRKRKLLKGWGIMASHPRHRAAWFSPRHLLTLITVLRISHSPCP